MTIGERIKKRREELGISVDELALVLNVNRATVYRYESNEISKLPVDILESVAKALRTTPVCLMGWEDENGKPTETSETAEFVRLFSKLPNDKQLLVINIIKGFLEEK